MRIFLIIISIFALPLLGVSQIRTGIGMTFSNDVYQIVSNPGNNSEGKIQNLIISPSFGPKFYLGNSFLSFSLQGNIGISIIGFDWRNYKGMGVAYAPVLAGINYGGLSGFTDNKSKWGFSVGYGYQFMLTDLYFKVDSFREETRAIFYPPFLQFAGGFGGKGAALYFYSRLGLNEAEGTLFSFGLNLEVNFRERRKWRN